MKREEEGEEYQVIKGMLQANKRGLQHQHPYKFTEYAIE